MVLRIPLVTPSRTRPSHAASGMLRPLGLRTGTRLGWTCIRCGARLVASVGPAPACSCGGVVRPRTTS